MLRGLNSPKPGSYGRNIIYLIVILNANKGKKDCRQQFEEAILQILGFKKIR